MTRRGIHLCSYLGVMIICLLQSSCDVLDPGDGDRLPGLCFNPVTTCPIDVVPLGENRSVIVGSSDLPVYPHPECLAINPNDRAERQACTIGKIREFLDDNIIYPQEAVDNSIEGTVSVFLTLSFPHGCISSIEVSRDLGYGTVCELQRVLTLMPSFQTTREASTPRFYGYRFGYQFIL